MYKKKLLFGLLILIILLIIVYIFISKKNNNILDLNNESKINQGYNYENYKINKEKGTFQINLGGGGR